MNEAIEPEVTCFSLTVYRLIDSKNKMKIFIFMVLKIQCAGLDTHFIILSFFFQAEWWE